MGRKKRARPVKDIDLLAIKPRFLRFFLLFLAAIGDVVILCSKYIFFSAKKGLSALPRFLASIKIRSYLGRFISTIFRPLQLALEALIQGWFTLQPSVKHTLQTRFSLWKTKFVLTFTQIKSIKLKKTASKRHFHISKPRLRVRFPFLGIRIPATATSFFLGILVTLIFVFIPYNLYLFIINLPNPHLLSDRFIPATTQIFDRNGILLYEIHADEDRKPIPLSQIPEFVSQATIAIEDKDFYKHHGFSLVGITRAARETFFKENIQGGSTITQQLVKSALLTPEISFIRKARELALSIWAEQIYSKDKILEMYLNQVPYGGTAWGIEAAAQRYFGKGVKDLNLAEAALLAGLPQAPTLYSPYGSRPDMAKVRQHEVLRRMVEDGYITQEQANITLATPLVYKPDTVSIKAPHFVMYVRELLTQKFGARLVDQGGLRITTSLDLSLQEKAQAVVTKQIVGLTNLQVGNGAALMTNPKNGDILAMVGSRDYFDTAHDGNVNVTLTPQQPGSSIKVVNYAAALENGLTAGTIIDDTPISFPIAGQPTYAPVNYDGRFHGRVTLRQALASSYNIPAVKVLNRIGVKTMIGMGVRMGITTWNDESRFGLSLTLGGGEVTMLDMATVYGVLANQGERVDLDPILEVKDYTGRIFYRKGEPDKKPVLSSEIAYILSDILADNAARTPAFGANSTLYIPGKTVSVKTGTTDQKRDNWTIGYTPSLVVTVWVGNNDNSPMNPTLASGVTGAAPIWHDLISESLANKPDEKPTIPANLVMMTCGRPEYFVKGTEPRSCPTPSVSPAPVAQTEGNNP